MFDITKLSKFLPTVETPVYKPSLNKKFLWTGAVLIVYFLMSSQLFGHVFGISPGGGLQLQTLQMLLGSTFGTLMTLGIGPVVTSSIILQLLVGSKIIDWDLTKEEEKKKYQVVQKLSSIAFCFLESVVFVLAGAVTLINNSPLIMIIVILQLAMGGIIVILLDEIVTKYGIGSGISLFIAAGVAHTIFIRVFTPFTMAGSFPDSTNPPTGLFWGFIYSLLGGNFNNVIINLLPIISTIVVFFIVVYAQSITVDIPLSFSSLRGFGRRWSLNLFYTSNMPVILAAALLANLQIMGNMFAQPLTDDPNTKCGLLGCVTQGPNGMTPIDGLVYYLSTPSGVLFDLFSGTITKNTLLRVLTYLVYMVGVSTIFSVIWVNTSGMDAESVANQITSIGMSIPGYRRDPETIKQVLNRYIPVLAVLGGASIGLLAAFADFTDALGTGTGILLTVTIIYTFYQQIKSEKIEQAHPLVRKIFKAD